MSTSDLVTAIRSPRWVIGLLFMGVSAVLQIVALTMAPVSLVQPVGLLAFPWSVLLAAAASRTRIPFTVGLAVAVTVAATLLVVLLLVAHVARRLGGIIGDAVGASVEVALAVLLIGFSAVIA